MEITAAVSFRRHSDTQFKYHQPALAAVRQRQKKRNRTEFNQQQLQQKNTNTRKKSVSGVE
jgi:hypothetical protein